MSNFVSIRYSIVTWHCKAENVSQRWPLLYYCPPPSLTAQSGKSVNCKIGFQAREVHFKTCVLAGCNIGDNVAIFEQGARHVGKDIVGKGIANPLATLLSTSMMFRHLNLPDFSDR